MVNGISLLDLTEVNVALNGNATNSQSQTNNQMMIIPKVKVQETEATEINN